MDLPHNEQLRTLVRLVADIPWGEARAVEDVLKQCKGTCTGKHLLLQACFEKLGIEYRPVVCTFRWQEQQLKLPQHLQKILDEHTWNHGHNFVQIQNPQGEWIDVDITWDSFLEEFGFSVLPQKWDGESSFVGLRSYVDRWDGVSIAEKKAELINSLTDEQREAREEFLDGFIEWIASLRD